MLGCYSVGVDHLHIKIISASDKKNKEKRLVNCEIEEERMKTILNQLVRWILISMVKKMDGQKVQEVRSVYNFVGEIPEIAA